MFKSQQHKQYKQLRPIVNQGRGIALYVDSSGGGWGSVFKDETGRSVSEGEVTVWLATTDIQWTRVGIMGTHWFYEFEDRESCTLFKMAHNFTQTLRGYGLIGSHLWGKL